MPTYPYKCPCGHTWEVVKRVAEIDTPESCPNCSAPGERYISRTYFYGASDWDKAEFNPALGCVTRNARHRREIAKSRGLEEIGNDYRDPNIMINENERKREEKRERRWAEI